MRCLFFDCDSYRQDIVVHGLQHAGEAWEDKLSRLRAALQEAGHGGMVVSELDEINWLLNIRGEGSSHNEVFFLCFSQFWKFNNFAAKCNEFAAKC